MQFFKKPILLLYRTFAILALYAVLIGVVVYIAILGFYAVNSQWVVPAVVTPSDLSSLSMADKVVTSTQTLAALQVDLDRQQKIIAEMTTHRESLRSLEPQLTRAIKRETENDRSDSAQLAILNDQKKADIVTTQNFVNDVSQIQARIDKELAAGLITKSDAILARSQLNDSRNALTDSRVNQVALGGAVLLKAVVNTAGLDVRDKQIELRSEVSTLDWTLAVARKQAAADEAQIASITAAMKAIYDTPYYVAQQSGAPVVVGFAPVDNSAAVVPGAYVYKCYLSFVACRYVGTVVRTFPAEQVVPNPIYHIDMRGHLAQLDLEDPQASNSQTLFVGSKPFGF